MPSGFCNLNRLTEGSSHFFGFHDLCPWSFDEKYLLCLRTDAPETRTPGFTDWAQVGYIDLATRKFVKVSDTNAWNWQQGCRQQWLPCKGESIFLFNARDKSGALRAFSYNLDFKKLELRFDPIYEISPNADLALSVDFERLACVYPGYGYAVPENRNRMEYFQDSIDLIDLGTGNRQPLVKLERLFDERLCVASPGKHFLTHPSFSPDGKKVCFIHRCDLDGGGQEAYFFVIWIETGEIRVLAKDKVSHFDWIDNDNIVLWCRHSPLIQRMKKHRPSLLKTLLVRLSRLVRSKKVRQAVYKESFRKLDINGGQDKVLGKGVLGCDGHPQIHPRFSNLWINDTYIDWTGRQTLMLYDASTNGRIVLCKLTSTAHPRSPWRCDLHPRWDRKGETICVDSSHEGRRQIYILDVSKFVDEQRRT